MIYLHTAQVKDDGLLSPTLSVKNIEQVNPITTDDSTEWFEIYNSGRGEVDMTGWLIEEFVAGNSHTMGSFSIGSGEYKVLGRKAAIPGISVDYVYGTAASSGYPLLNNDGDLIRLTGNGAIQDVVDYRTTMGIPNTFPSSSGTANAGKSIQLKSLDLDNNEGSNWCQSTSGWSGATTGDKGTPRQANNNCA